MIDAVAQAVAAMPANGTARLGLAMLLSHADRWAEAAEVLAPELQSGFATIRRDLTWSGGMSMCAETVAVLDQPAAAVELYAQLAPYGDVLPCNSVVVFEVLHWGLGRLASSLGRYGEAELHFVQAEEVHRRLGARYFLARTYWAWAEMLVARGRAEEFARGPGIWPAERPSRPLLAAIAGSKRRPGRCCGGSRRSRESNPATEPDGLPSKI